MKSLLSIITVLIFSLVSNAQNYITISGKVIDQETKEPLPFASIYIKNNATGTTSNKDGTFIFHVSTHLSKEPVIISMIGYKSIEIPANQFTINQTIYLQQSIAQLDNVILTSGKPLSAKKIVKKAYKAIDTNYPKEPYILEGFIRDLQNEDGQYVELLECAVKFYYKDYKDYNSPKVELQEVRQSYIAKKHSWNEDFERKNSIVDLIEDDFIRYDYGPIKVKNGWSYKIESILPFANRLVYKIIGKNPPFQKTTLYIDTENFAFVRMELTRSRNKEKYYKRRLTNGQQEAGYHIVFEYQEHEGKMYLKYLKEEDTWHIFNGSGSNQILFKKHPKKELFINRITTKNLNNHSFSNNLDITKSIENQAGLYNPEFWKYYNAPTLTLQESKIVEELKKAQINISRKE
ncbi:carboxypeptidase-like regulatory domain-containing protein [Aquimarina sp. 2304DJ70-9]|uniref:carboxypeptidase-like regulatory domain-containing protein n=1 Tax=Aquimarina penaris TaxID=3231044 RepID=UPI0034636165